MEPESLTDVFDGKYFELLEKDQPLSRSKIWKMLEAYYDSASLSAWNQIPFYPTSNPYIAETYAEMILFFLRDYLPYLHVDEPIYIIEMAAGSGCFSFYLLKELQRKIHCFDKLSKLSLKYLMTDFTENNVRTWEKNPKLQPFVQEGLLEFAVFRPETDTVLKLRPSQTLLEPGVTRNPIIAIANYFFDSIRQDAFQIQSGQLKEVLHSFYNRKTDEGRKTDKVGEGTFERLVKIETYADAKPSYYAEPELNQILRQYQEEYAEASVLFPLGAFDCLKNLRALASNKLVLLSSDKGFTDKAYIEGLREQPFLPHHGVFSYSVNYDAIAKYFINGGGISLSTTDDNLSIASSASFLLPELAEGRKILEESHFYFQEKVNKQNLSNYLYFLQDILTEVEPRAVNEVLRACLGYIQLCNFDPIVFCLAAPKIYGALETVTPGQEERLCEIIDKVRDNFYSVVQQFDVFYWIGRVFYGLNHLDSALADFARSIEIFGRSSSSLYYMAACFEAKCQFDEALACYEDALKLEPGCSYTKDGISRIQRKLHET